MSQKTKMSFQKLDDLRNRSLKNGGSNNVTLNKDKSNNSSKDSDNEQNEVKQSTNKSNTGKGGMQNDKTKANKNNNVLKNNQESPIQETETTQETIKDSQKVSENEQDYKASNKAGNVYTKPTNDEAGLLKVQLNLLTQERDDWKNRCVRLTADLQNLQKQNELDKQNVKKNTKKLLLNNLLTFLNTLNLAFAHKPDTRDENVLKFITTLESSFSKVIEDISKDGVEIVVPKRGDSFDPSIMYALNSGEEGDELVVKQVVGLGLKIDGQVVQSATVML